jgi:hypothetical protein
MSRCVHCGRDASSPEPCKYGPQKAHASLHLPTGKTCGDCVHITRCQAIFGHVPADKYCDWFPIRFREAPAELAVRR